MKKLLKALVLALALLLAGCATTGGKVRLGMTTQEAVQAWGRPDHVSRSVRRDGVLEIWRYGEYYQRYTKKYWLTFYNGELVEISN